MREQHREIKERIFAIALSLFMILSMFPITVFAAEGSTISTNIGTVTAYRGMVTEFTVSVTPNDDAGETVVGTFEFDDPDAVTGFEIYDAESGEWNEFSGTIGDGGISFDGADYLLRAIFTEKGDYTFTGSFKKSGTSDELCSVSQKFTVGEVCTVTSNLKDKTIVLGEATEFSVSTTKTAVIDPTSVSFVFEFDEATVGKLEYYDQNEKAWKEFVEVYAESGILLQNKTYDFRATFVKMGENHIEVKVRKVADKNIISSKNDEIVANAKLSVSAGKGGSCTIDGDSVSSVNFCEESDFTVQVTPSEGFWIKSVEIDDIEQTVSDPEGIELTLNNLSANANVVAEFVPIYTVSVTSNDNGTVDLPEGGSVTVASGSEVSVKATPSEGYRVAKVVVNKVESTFTDNDYVFEDSYIVEKPHDIVVTFAPNVYTVTAEKTVNGTVSVASDKVEYLGSDVVTLTPAESYTVDQVFVNEDEITKLTKDKDGVHFTISDISENKTVSATFKAISAATTDDFAVEEDNVVFKSSDDNTDVYVAKKDTTVTVSTENNGIRLVLDSDSVLSGEKEVTVSEDVNISKVGVLYKAEDDLVEEWHYYDAKAIVISFDVTAPQLTLTPDEANEYGYYNDDVTIGVSATDPGYYSGIAKVEYTVTSGENTSAPKTVFTLSGTASDTFETDNTNAIVIDAEDYNAAGVIVTVTVYDVSGNSASKSITLNINSTKPTVAVDIDGEISKNAQKGYYSCDRVLTITVGDRADTFSPENAAAGLTITKDGEVYEVAKDDISWTSVGDVHTGSYTFSEEGAYEWSVSYTNKAGLSEETVSTPRDAGEKSLFAFTIDKTAPDGIDFSYSDGVADASIGGVEYGFHNSSVDVTLSADDFSGVASFEYLYTVENGASAVNVGGSGKITESDGITESEGTYSAQFTIPSDDDHQFRGNVSFKATDKAGNVSELTPDGKVIIVDTKAPVVTVTYDNNQVYNESYYGADRTATITVNEANFFTDAFGKLTDTVTSAEIAEHIVITVSKTPNDGNPSESVLANSDLTTPFAQTDGDNWTATLKFDEECDYSWSVTYTDYSGNSAEAFTDSFTIDKTAPEVAVSHGADDYTNAKDGVKVTVTVTEHNFDKRFVSVTALTAKDITGNDVDGITKDYTELLKNGDWKTQGDVHTIELLFDVDANYNFTVSCTDLANNNDAEDDTFCLDRVKPDTTTFSITYSKSIIDMILESASFGFYQAPLTVTLEATDTMSGIEYFIYSCTVSAGVSTVNKGTSGVTAEVMDFNPTTGHGSVMFSVPAQFRGLVSFTAHDRAGNQSDSYGDARIMVVDDIAPIISVTYDNIVAENEKYYSKPRTATISVNEANFFNDPSESFTITVTKVTNDGKSTKQSYGIGNLPSGFNRELNDTWTTTLLFEEDAEYKWSVDYTDFSGNKADTFSDEFIVDTTDPEVKITYDNNDARNGLYFNKNRTATIEIREHNFNAETVTAVVTARNETSAVEDFGSYLSNPDHWADAGDLHTAMITFDAEAEYKFDLTCTDLAGRKNTEVDYVDSKAPTEFVIDKTAPTDADITVNGESVLAKNGIAFEKFYRDGISVGYNVNCDISGLDTVEYRAVSRASEYSENGEWTLFENDLRIDTNEKVILFFKAQDKAGNVTIVNSTGIIIDDKAPVGERYAPEIDIIPEAGDENTVYASDVTVDIKVIDPAYSGTAQTKDGYYSGINKITYRIYAPDVNGEESGVLFDLNDPAVSDIGAVHDSEGIISEWSGKINVSAAVFNSNNVTVEIIAVDNAGNERLTTNGMIGRPIAIDMTAPSVSVSYDNNNGVSPRSVKTYFNNDRTATIVITERNLDPNSVNVKITNSNDAVPVISAFTAVKNGGNGDADTYTAQIRFSSDGDYTFDISCTDRAGNANTAPVYLGTAPREFTIDKTAPTVSVAFDNDTPSNGMYYNSGRTGTIIVNDGNFGGELVKVAVTATVNGVANTTAADCTWTANGNSHTTSVAFSEDAEYVVTVNCSDLAGNIAPAFTSERFVIDTTAPTIEITGVEDRSANAGEVRPVITYYDTNFDASLVSVTVSGVNHTAAEMTGEYTDIENGQIYTLDDFAAEEDVDDIYTLSVDMTDKAGNVSSKSITFSVNRFGSTYDLGENTKALVGTYAGEPVDVVITETNADELKNVKLTLFRNNETVELEEGKDFECKTDPNGGNDQWYCYTYTVFAKNFENDGVYRVVIHSEDAAGNIAENTLDTKNTAIQFGIDTTKPTITVDNLDSDVTYALDEMNIEMNINDNLLLDRVLVFLDDFEHAYKEWKASEAPDGNYSFLIPGDSTKAHNLKVVCIDAAGNEETEEITDFFVTTNVLVRYYNNKGLFFGSIGGVVAIAGGATLLAVLKRKRRIAG